MMSHVVFQVARLREPFVTFNALIRPFSGVNTLVRLQVDSLRESLITVRTGVRSNILVNHHMSSKVCRVQHRQLFAANRTFSSSTATFHVNGLVSFEILRRVERHATFVASMQSHAIVSVHMLLKVILLVESFSAPVALKPSRPGVAFHVFA
jgi:hypothetical protein